MLEAPVPEDKDLVKALGKSQRSIVALRNHSRRLAGSAAGRPAQSWDANASRSQTHRLACRASSSPAPLSASLEEKLFDSILKLPFNLIPL